MIILRGNDTDRQTVHDRLAEHVGHTLVAKAYYDGEVAQLQCVTCNHLLVLEARP